MGGRATQPTETTIEAFLAGIADERRRTETVTVADVMAAATGQPAIIWGTAIVGFGEYETPSGPWPAVAFAPRKQHIVLYLGDPDTFTSILGRLGRHKLGKGCLYLPAVDAVDRAVLEELVAAAYAARQS